MTEKESSTIHRIIILGHTGFVGNRLMEHFHEKYPAIEVLGKSSHELDLTNREAAMELKNLFNLNTAVIMCSGIKSDYGNNLESYSKNVQMAENVCKVVSEHPVKKFIFFSSIAVYGVDTHNTAISEETETKPDTYYSLSKVVSEKLFTFCFSKLKESSLILLRTPMIYGPNEKIIVHTPSGFLKTYLQGGEVTLWGDGSELREFLFIEDLVKIVDSLVFNSFSGILNPGSGRGTSYKESLDIIQKLLGRKIIVHSKPRSKEKVDKVYKNELFKKLFPGFSFTSLEDGLKLILNHETGKAKSTCVLCQKPAMRCCLDLGRQPIYNRFLKNVSEEERTFPLSFGQCQLCGLAQLMDRVPPQELVPPYDWITYMEPENHLDDLAKQIKTLPGLNSQSKILGISFKDQSLVKRMRHLGFLNAKTLDLKKDLGVENSQAGVESVQMKLTPQKAKEIVQKEGRFDLVIARHILEHAVSIHDFVNALKELLTPQGYLLVEVPDCTQAFEKKNYAVLWEEHISYFTPLTLQKVFQQFGLRLVHFENVPYMLENSLILIGKKTNEPGSILMQDEELKKEKKRVDAFSADFKITQKLLQDYLCDFRKRNGKIAFLGAGHLACGFINFLKIADFIDCVIDNDPKKIGLRLAGSRLPIYDSSAVLKRKIRLCLLGVNPSNEDKFLKKNKVLLKKGIDIFSIFSESNYALPILKNGIKLEKVNEEVYIARNRIAKIDQNNVSFIQERAINSPRKRCRICIHQDVNDPIHEMMICLAKESYIRPHKHSNKPESFHMIQGEIDVVIFDENGKIEEIIEMGEPRSNKKFYYHSPENCYHSVIVKTKTAIYHEITKGPFNKDENIFAPWSPEENDPEGIARFLNVIEEYKKSHRE